MVLENLVLVELADKALKAAERTTQGIDGKHLKANDCYLARLDC